MSTAGYKAYAGYCVRLGSSARRSSFTIHSPLTLTNDEGDRAIQCLGAMYRPYSPV